MELDHYHQQIYNEDDILNEYMSDHSVDISRMLVSTSIDFDDSLELDNIPDLTPYKPPTITVDEFHHENQSKWHMPIQYSELDIVKYVIDLCQCDNEIDRVARELVKFQDRNLFPLLRYLVYLVHTMRSNNITWGVGRGSSVSSYVLYLIGVHKIDSIKYDLSEDEYFK